MSVSGGFTGRVSRTAVARAGLNIADQFNGLENYGRVVDVITSPSHPYYSKFGGSQALYGVIYQRLFEGSSDNISDIARIQFAYCLDSTIRRVPIKNEIVKLESVLGADITEDLEAAKVPLQKVYWTDIISLWNSPHLNAYPDTLKYSGQTDTGKNFIEQDSVRPLQLSEGDVCVEGRWGQSLRFSNTKGKPFLILRNSQGFSSGDVAGENPDKDGSSIYMTSDQTVDVTEARTKRKAWKEEPNKFKDYKGNQIAAISDRLVLNAREEDIQLNAKENLGIVAKVVGVDGEEYVAFDAKKIYLGTAALKEREPVLLGRTSTDWLKDLVEILEKLLNVMKTPGAPPVWVNAVALASNMALAFLLQKKAVLRTLESKKVFTE